MNIHILRVVDVLVGPVLDAVDDAGFEVEEDGARDVACVVGLVEEDVFAVAGRVGDGFGQELAVLRDAVFAAELLPEFAADAVAALAGLEGYDFTFFSIISCLIM